MCDKCGAHFWVDEATQKKIYTKCCMNGRIRFDLLNPPNQLMQELFSSKTQQGKMFQAKIRKFNTSLSFASTIFKSRNLTSPGPPIVSVEGNIQHKIGSLYNNPEQTAQFMQCYFYEEGENDNTNSNQKQGFFNFTNTEVISF